MECQSGGGIGSGDSDCTGRGRSDRSVHRPAGVGVGRRPPAARAFLRVLGAEAPVAFLDDLSKTPGSEQAWKIK